MCENVNKGGESCLKDIKTKAALTLPLQSVALRLDSMLTWYSDRDTGWRTKESEFISRYRHEILMFSKASESLWGPFAVATGMYSTGEG